MNSTCFLRLFDFSVKTGSSIVVPQVVMLELSRLYEIELRQVLETNKKLVQSLASLGLERSSITSPYFNISELILTYEEYVRNKLSRYYLCEPPCKDEYLSEVLKRWRSGLKPFSGKGEGFRDALIWLSVVDHAKKNKYYNSYAFISNNSRDFCNEKKNDFHHDLKAELENEGIKMKFYSSLEEFDQYVISRTDFITAEWLAENLDWNRLNLKVVEGVKGIHCVFFYSNYDEERLSESLKYWEIIDARYNQTVDMFFFSKEMGTDTYRVDLFLSGRTCIRFIGESGRYYETSKNFFAQIGIHITNKLICGYQDHYYEEETVLEIPETLIGNGLSFF